MKLTTLFKTVLVLITLILSGAVYAQKKETVTITGRLIDAVTGKKPVAVVTINEKGVGEYFVFGEISSNHHTIMDEKGNFSIEIQKGGSLSFNPTGYFKKTELDNLTKSQHVEVKLYYYKTPVMKLDANTDVYNIGTKTYIVKGKVINADTGKPLKNVSVSEFLVYNEKGSNRHVLTDQNGNYSFTIHENSTIDFDGIGVVNQKFSKISHDRSIDVALKLRTK